MDRKFLIAGAGSALAVVLGLGVGGYASPYFVPDQIVKAAKADDSDKLNRLIDFPSIRSSLKDELSTKMHEVAEKKLSEDKDTASNPFAQGLAQLAIGMVSMVVNGMVDQVVKPEALEKVVKHEPVKVTVMGQERDVLKDFTPDDPKGRGYNVSTRYVDWGDFEYRLVSKADHGQVIVVKMRRTGLFDWQVTRVALDVDMDKVMGSIHPPDNNSNTSGGNAAPDTLAATSASSDAGVVTQSDGDQVPQPNAVSDAGVADSSAPPASEPASSQPQQ